MGHKVHPIGIRLGISKDWNSKWYANKAEFAGYLAADLKVREMLRKKLAQAGISKILIERPAKTARVTIHTARPGVVIGKRGEDIEKLRKKLMEMTKSETHLNIVEVRKPEIDAAEFRKRLAAARGEAPPTKVQPKIRRTVAPLKPCVAYACVRETEGSRWIDISTISCMRETAKALGDDFNACVPTYVGSDGCNRIINVVKVNITIEVE